MATLDRIDWGPASAGGSQTPSGPQPSVVAPSPAASVPPAASHAIPTFKLSVVLIWIVVFGFILYEAYTRFPGIIDVPKPGPGTVLATATRSYIAELGPAYADKADAFADSLEGGKTLEKAQEDAVKAWKTSSDEAFNRLLDPPLETVYPASEKFTPERRKAYAAAWRSVAKAARGTK